MFLLSLTLTASTGSAPASGAIEAASVTYDRDDGGRCEGVCIDSNPGYSVVATSAHCLPSVPTEVSLRGNRPLDVVIHPLAVLDPSDRQKLKDYDFALIVFDEGVCRTSVPVESRRMAPNEPVNVVVRGRTLSERCLLYQFNSTAKFNPDGTLIDDGSAFDVYLAISNQSQFVQGDSGAGAFTTSGKYLGALRGCLPNECGIFSPWAGNKTTQKIFEIAERRGYLTANVTVPSAMPPKPSTPVVTTIEPPMPSPEIPGIPGIPSIPEFKQAKTYVCKASCAVKFGGRDADRGTENEIVETETFQRSLEAAIEKAKKNLTEYCELHCEFKRYAISCRLTSEPSCEEKREKH